MPVRLAPGLIEPMQPMTLPSMHPTQPQGTQDQFSDLLSNALQSVNELHQESAAAQTALLNGEPIELHQVMIAAEKSSLSTDLLLEVRNRMLNAYNQLINMPM